MDSSNSSCNYNPISFITTENDIHDSSSFINFPNSPQSTTHYEEAVYLYEQLYFSQYHHQQQQQPMATISPDNNRDIITTNTNNIPTLIPDSKQLEKPMKIQKSSSSKKHRHSKINTANGPRDRRMRLSLDVARNFFDLQDMLGFDKASRTVDWLLKNSWNAIKGLSGIKTNTTCAGSSISEEYNNCVEQQEVLSSSKKKITKGKEIVNSVPRVIVGKESRKNARERARNRTSQKKRLIITAQNPISCAANPCEERRGNIIGMDRDAIVVDNNNSLFFDSTAPWNGSIVTQENAAIFHSHHLAELQFSGKQWDAYEAYNGSNFSG